MASQIKMVDRTSDQSPDVIFEFGGLAEKSEHAAMVIGIEMEVDAAGKRMRRGFKPRRIASFTDVDDGLKDRRRAGQIVRAPWRRRAWRIRRRSRSERPPHTPWSMLFSSAYSRHCCWAGHVAQIFCARITPTPSLGKKMSGLTSRHFPLSIHAASICSYLLGLSLL
jgi:hypothetical protein